MNPIARTEAELDLALAAELQAALLPKSCPHNCPHQVATAMNRMCRTVGGDFHDFLRLNEDQVAIVIGDVVGHGVRSSLLMAQIMGWLRSDRGQHARPLKVMTDLNRMLIDLGDKTDSVLPCSMIYTVIDGPTGLALFVNAGHPRPVLCGPDRCGAAGLGSRNILLGVQDVPFEEGCLTFQPGERLVLYTDGVVDAINRSDEPFGMERLHGVLAGHPNSTPQECAAAVFQAVDDFRQGAPQRDDETIVVVDRV